MRGIVSLDSSVHVSVAGSHNSADNSAWVSSLNPGPLVPPVIRTLPSGRTVPFKWRRGWNIDWVNRHAGDGSFRSTTSAVLVGGVMSPPAIKIFPGRYITAVP